MADSIVPRKWPEVQEILGPLATHRLEELKRSIKEYGYKGPPVYLMPDGRIIDGHHREEILNGDCPTEVLDVDEATGFGLALAHNLSRRHFSLQQLDEIDLARKKAYRAFRELGMSQADARRKVAVAQRTASDWDEKNIGNSGSAISDIPQQRPRGRTPKLKAEDKEKIHQRVASGETQVQVAQDYQVAQSTVSEIVRRREKKATVKAQRKARSEEAAKQIAPKGLRIEHADFRTFAETIPDESISLIFTDPPYSRKHLEDYGNLAEIAARVLMPGGSLLCYAGHYLLHEIYPLMAHHIRPWWVFAATHGGRKARMTEYGVVVCWKPILWFVKKTRSDKDTFIDDLTVGDREKEEHEWQQSVREAEYFIGKLSMPGEIVWDPFCGGGTTALAALKLGRKAITCDVDVDALASARARIIGAMPGDAS
jgi:transposase